MARRGRPTSSSEGAGEAIDLVVSFREDRGWSEAQLARTVGLSQSAVNRALNTDKARWTPALIALSSYALKGVDDKKSLPAEVVDALAKLWDGSPADGRRIASLLTLVGEFRKPSDGSGIIH